MSFTAPRRDRRYPLRLAIRLHRGSEVLDAAILDASPNSCLMVSSVPLEAGEVLEASIPELLIPRSKLHVIRCSATPSGYMVAACFETLLEEDKPSFTWSAEEPQAARQASLLN